MFKVSIVHYCREGKFNGNSALLKVRLVASSLGKLLHNYYVGKANNFNFGLGGQNFCLVCLLNQGRAAPPPVLIKGRKVRTRPLEAKSKNPFLSQKSKFKFRAAFYKGKGSCMGTKIEI